MLLFPDSRDSGYRSDRNYYNQTYISYNTGNRYDKQYRHDNRQRAPEYIIDNNEIIFKVHNGDWGEARVKAYKVYNGMLATMDEWHIVSNFRTGTIR